VESLWYSDLHMSKVDAVGEFEELKMGLEVVGYQLF
jgi:hypothetical protein